MIGCEIAHIFSPCSPRLVHRFFRHSDSRPGARMARDFERRMDADHRSDRQRKDADRLPLGARPPDVHRTPRKIAPLPCDLHLTAEGAGGRCRAKPPRATHRHRESGVGARRKVRDAGDRDPHRRHPRERARAIPTPPTRPAAPPATERAKFQRTPADILITTPESIYLLLTSNAREVLRGVQTVIIDEIHALVPTKRGAHLALSLERLSMLCDEEPQRIGLSATQRPLDEVARFLGGVASDRLPVTRATGNRQPATDLHSEFTDHTKPRFRKTHIIDTGERKQL